MWGVKLPPLYSFIALILTIVDGFHLCMGACPAELDAFLFDHFRHSGAYFNGNSPQAVEAMRVLNTFLAGNGASGVFGVPLSENRFRHDPLFFGLRPVFPLPDLNRTNLGSPSDTSVFKMVVQRVLEAIPTTVGHLDLYDLGAGGLLPSLGGLVSNPRWHSHAIYQQPSGPPEFSDEGHLLVIERGERFPSISTWRGHQADARYGFVIHAVDVDEVALEQAKMNAHFLNRLDYICRLVLSDMLAVLPGLEHQPNIAVVSNPPYVPVPKGADSAFLAVNGGEDGTRFLRPLLQNKYAPGTHVGLLLSSLSNPAALIDIIEKNYDVIEVRGIQIFFGPYTTRLLPYLLQLREQGKAIFSSVDDIHYYLLLGVVLRKK